MIRMLECTMGVDCRRILGAAPYLPSSASLEWLDGVGKFYLG